MIQIGRRKLTLVGLFLALIVALLVVTPTAKGQLIVDVSHSPDVPLPGEEVNVTMTVTNYSDVVFAELIWCNFDTSSCVPKLMTYAGNNTYWGTIGGAEGIKNGTIIGYNITVENTTGHREYRPLGQKYINITYVGPLPRELPEPPLITLDFILIEGLLVGLIIALVAMLIWKNRKGLEMSKVAALGVVFITLFASIYGGLYFLTRPTSIELAKDFTAVDTENNTFNLSDFRGEVVVLDFMSIHCGGCKIIASTIRTDVYPHYEDSELEVISIDVGPSDTLDDLRALKEDEQIPWRMAMNPGGLVGDYAAAPLPTVIIIDKDGYVVNIVRDSYASASSLRAKIDDALAGTAQVIGIQAVSGIVLAAFAGFATFFSPCSFPMLPGFIAYYLSEEAQQKKKGTLRVLGSGLIAGIGVTLVFLILGIALIVAGSAVNLTQYTPILGPIVGVILILLGALMFTNLQYHALLRPFSKLKEVFTRGKSREASGYYPKLFGYGVGYGAAASACTAPLFLAVMAQSSISGGVMEGLLVLLVFSLMIILLMVVITFMLSAFGQESVRKLSQYTDLIKKVSAVVLIIVGAYLIFYFFTTHGF